MAGDDSSYTSTARALASSDSPSPPHTRTSTTSPSWSRRSLSLPTTDRARTARDRWLRSAERLQRHGVRIWTNFTPIQRVGITILGLTAFVGIILALVYNEQFFHWLAPAARRWRELPAGWLILWALTFAVSFPPAIGYSTCVTLAGFVFGMRGWFIVASATVLGSTSAFLVSRTLLRGFVSRLTEKNQRFAALALVLKHDGLSLLVLIRLCPLPYSLANGAISTIPTVTWQSFMLATALASPKLLLHVFVGSRLGDLAENGDKMDFRTKMVSYVSIAIGMLAGAGTGYFIYARTKKRAAQLEAEEAAQQQQPGRRSGSDAGFEYMDHSDEHGGEGRRGVDDISLHQTYEDDLEAADNGYRDEFTDDEDAFERDVFDEGDGGEEDGKGRKR